MSEYEPSIYQLKRVPGYEKVGFKPVLVSPTNHLGTTDCTKEDFEETTESNDRHRSLKITRGNIDVALKDFLKGMKHLRWRNFMKADLGQVINRNLLCYSLETLTEKKTVRWAYEPATDEALDGTGPVPLPWEVEVGRPAAGRFQNEQRVVEIPNSSNIQRCFECVGLRRTVCDDCKGHGGKLCIYCSGRGVLSATQCKDCRGRGFIPCYRCKVFGQVPCVVCKRTGRLRYYLQLTVQYINHRSDELSQEVSDLPRQNIFDSEGDVVWTSCGERVQPVKDFQNVVLRTASANFIKDHEATLANETVIKQRQTIRCIPVAEVNYSHRRNRGRFFVSGLKGKIYFPKNEKPKMWKAIL